jgi:hypothetical protein
MLNFSFGSGQKSVDPILNESIMSVKKNNRIIIIWSLYLHDVIITGSQIINYDQ